MLPDNISTGGSTTAAPAPAPPARGFKSALLIMVMVAGLQQRHPADAKHSDETGPAAMSCATGGRWTHFATAWDYTCEKNLSWNLKNGNLEPTAATRTAEPPAAGAPSNATRVWRYSPGVYTTNATASVAAIQAAAPRVVCDSDGECGVVANSTIFVEAVNASVPCSLWFAGAQLRQNRSISPNGWWILTRTGDPAPRVQCEGQPDTQWPLPLSPSAPTATRVKIDDTAASPSPHANLSASEVPELGSSGTSPSLRLTRRSITCETDSTLGLTEICYSPENSHVFLGSPSIIRVDNGDLIATSDRFGTGHHPHDTSVVQILWS